jgi:hypothetical protein
LYRVSNLTWDELYQLRFAELRPKFATRVAVRVVGTGSLVSRRHLPDDR